MCIRRIYVRSVLNLRGGDYRYGDSAREPAANGVLLAAAGGLGGHGDESEGGGGRLGGRRGGDLVRPGPRRRRRGGRGGESKGGGRRHRIGAVAPPRRRSEAAAMRLSMTIWTSAPRSSCADRRRAHRNFLIEPDAHCCLQRRCASAAASLTFVTRAATRSTRSSRLTNLNGTRISSCHRATDC